jgi:HD superfamily phosphodiesterase
MKLDKQTEEKVKAEAIKFLEMGKPKWGIPHTLAAVYYIRKLIEKEGGDERILVTVMYLHDAAYPKFKEKYSFDDVLNAKKYHMTEGAKLAKEILSKLNYSSDEIKQIAHLVEVHDKLDRLSSHDEILVMEADTLAQIDTDRTVKTLDDKSYKEFLEHLKKRRVPLFKTETGKKLLKPLLKRV